MPVYEPNLDLLRQAFGNRIQACRAELIKVALGWSRVYRVTLTSSGGRQPPFESVVVKTADPRGPATAGEAIRELRYYENLHPGLFARPEIYHLTTDEETGFHAIVMEDLSATHRIPAHPYQWSYEELKAVLRAYAYLHTRPIEKLDYPWLAPRHESVLEFEKIPDQVFTIQQAGIWGDLTGLPDLIAFVQESCRTFVDERVSLLHGDTTPANAPLPVDLESGSATLIDWQDVGPGMPEFDLAYMDLQPFESARGVPRPDLLELYWCLRSEIDPEIPPARERRLRQLHADAVFTLWLTASASRVARQPFPEGSYPQIHWSSQFGIVYNRLKTLADEISN